MVEPSVSTVVRNNVHVSGRGRQAMLFVHGFGCDQNVWRDVAPYFEDQYRVVLLDLVGAGKSDLTAYSHARHGSLEGHARDVLDICAELDLRRIIFVGHSVSAMIGALVAKAMPQIVETLVLVAPSPRYIDDHDYIGGFSAAQIEELLDGMDDNDLGGSSSLGPLIMGNPERPELSEELVSNFCRTDPAIARHFARVTFTSDHRAVLPFVRSRCLVLQCARDPIAPRSVGEYTHQHLAQSTLVLMNATGHCPHMSAPAETRDAIRSFLDG